MRSVIIYRDGLLPLSETFIRSQVRSMTRFTGVYAGCRRIPGLDLSGNPAVILRGKRFGRVRETIFKEFGRANNFVKELKQYEPSLLHAHFGPDGAVALPLAQSLKIPVVVTFHGFDANLTNEALRETHWGKRYLRRRDALKRDGAQFIAVSDFIARRLISQGFPADKVHVHYIGVDTDQFRCRTDRKREDIVLFVGRLVEKKGCEHLVRAMANVQRSVPDCGLIIIGDGPLRGELESLAASQLQEFRFLGAQPEDVVRDWMAKAAVFCGPSVVAKSGDAEGFGIVFIEAQASGLPVVSFASGGIPEAVAHGVTGYLAPEKDVGALSNYLVELLKDDATRLKFSSAGRERVKNGFDLKVQTAKLEQIYEHTLAGAIA
jgi:colanic acid/amylovoran biosynthesis glycosyltransferase